MRKNGKLYNSTKRVRKKECEDGIDEEFEKI